MATLPLLEINGAISNGTLYINVAVYLPALTCSASCGSRNAMSIPAPTLSASCHADYGGRVSKYIPAVTLSANSFQDGYCNLDKSLGAITLSASGEVLPSSTLSRSIPAIHLTAKCVGNIYGNLDQSIGAITISASSHETSDCRTTAILPAIVLSARIQEIAADIIALCLNTKNFGLTKYTSYDYNSLCVFNGKTIGAKRTGIYELSGNNDDGTSISWKLRSGKIDLGDSKLRSVRLSGKLSGDLKMIVETADGNRYEYDAEPVSETEDVIRVKVGKHLCSGKGFHDKYAYLAIEFQNESDQIVTVDKIEGYGVKR